MAIYVPYPPSANSCWRAVKGRVIKSLAYRVWLKLAKWQIQEQKPEKVEGPVHLRIVIRRPDRRKRDLDNPIKPIIDSLKDLAFEDDHNVERLVVEWEDAKPGPVVEVLVAKEADGEHKRSIGPKS